MLSHKAKQTPRAWVKDMRQVTKKHAIKLYDNKVLEGWELERKVEFQLNQKRLCMPFNLFHKAVQEYFKRPVYTHEFADQQSMLKEFYSIKSQAPKA